MKLFVFDIDSNGYYLDRWPISYDVVNLLSKNDGLKIDDFDKWFNKIPFGGQVICWNPKIEYL